MIDVTLKAKHLYFVANQLQNVVARRFFSLLSEIKIETTSKGLEDDCNLTVSTEDFKEIYNILGAMPENKTARINREINSLLEPQIFAGVQAGNPEYIDVAMHIQSATDATSDWVASQIEEGKNSLV